MANPQYVFSLERVRKVYDHKEVLKGITLSFLPGAKIGIIGANGAGKSSLLKIMAGLDKDFDGEALPAPGTRIGYVLQEPRLDPSKDVRGNIEDGLGETKALLTRFDEINVQLGEVEGDKMDALLDEMARVQEQIDARDGWNLDTHVGIAMEALRTPPGDASVATLSGGEKRRVALAKVLLSRPDLLLLDEPTNHLDADSVAWLEEHLRDYNGTVLLVTHDRYFLDNVVGWMLEIDRGRGIPYQGNYTAYLEQKAKRVEVDQREHERREKHLARELEWVRTSPSARTVKNRARLRRYEELLRDEYEHAEDEIDLQIPPGPRLGDRVFQLEHVSKAYGTKKVIDDLTVEIPRSAIVGIIGPNGAGKTTLFRLLTGVETPDAGKVVVGETVHMTYVDQQREDLEPEKTVFEEISGGNEWLEFGTQRIHARGYISRFNFRGEDQQKKVGELSGGQRNRIQLAKLLRKGANTLLLDEPTNDLDLPTLRVLEDALSAFAGTVLVVSHDRWFLDRIATHILAFEGDGRVRWFEGGYTAYAERRAEELGGGGDRRGPRRRLFSK
jgi:energy-dependent translational throttle protein EttA